MKKWIALVLALVMVLALCGCGSANAGTTAKTEETEKNKDRDTAPTEAPLPVLTDSDALALVKEMVPLHDSFILWAAKAYNDDVYSVSSISVASASVTKLGYYNYSSKNPYEIVVKGTFTAKDDFGNYIDKYNFTWTLTVDYYERTTNWLHLPWDGVDDDYIVISE